MKITIQQRRTVGELLAHVHNKYGSIRVLQSYVKDNPQDVMAKLALHDVREYKGEDSNKVITETREVIIPDAGINQLTVQRLQILLTLKGLVGAPPSARALARALNRDIKNVSDDIRVLNSLGLLDVETAGRGKPLRVSLPGDRIDLHLVEAEA